MVGISGSQGSYLLRGAPFLLGTGGGVRMPANSASGMSVTTDIAGATGDVNKAANQSLGVAAGRAADEVGALSSLARSLGNNPSGLGVVSLGYDRNGALVAAGKLDAAGDLSIYGSGSSNGAYSEVGVSIAGQNGSDDWSSQAANGLALASYNINSVLEKIGQKQGGSGVDVSA